MKAQQSSSLSLNFSDFFNAIDDKLLLLRRLGGRVFVCILVININKLDEKSSKRRLVGRGGRGRE